MLIVLDPDARLDVAFNWSAWLADTETIVGQTVTATTGVTVETSAQSAGVVTAWLTDGTVGANATVTCHIVTDAGREDDRSISVRVRNR